MALPLLPFGVPQWPMLHAWHLLGVKPTCKRWLMDAWRRFRFYDIHFKGQKRNKTVVKLRWYVYITIVTRVIYCFSRCFFFKRNPKKYIRRCVSMDDLIFALPRARSQNQIRPHPRFILQRSVCCGFSRLGPCTTKSTGRFRLYPLFLLGYLACIGSHSQESRNAGEQQGILVVKNPFINPCF